MRRKVEPLLCELHAHKRWSDGALTLSELVDLYGTNGFDVLAVTDHVVRPDPGAEGLPFGVNGGNHSDYLAEIAAQAERARRHYDLLVLPGLELTYDDADRSRPRTRSLSACATSWASTRGSSRRSPASARPERPSSRLIRTTRFPERLLRRGPHSGSRTTGASSSRSSTVGSCSTAGSCSAGWRSRAYLRWRAATSTSRRTFSAGRRYCHARSVRTRWSGTCARPDRRSSPGSTTSRCSAQPNVEGGNTCARNGRCNAHGSRARHLRRPLLRHHARGTDAKPPRGGTARRRAGIEGVRRRRAPPTRLSRLLANDGAGRNRCHDEADPALERGDRPLVRRPRPGLRAIRSRRPHLGRPRGDHGGARFVHRVLCAVRLRPARLRRALRRETRALARGPRQRAGHLARQASSAAGERRRVAATGAAATPRLGRRRRQPRVGREGSHPRAASRPRDHRR